MNKLKHWNVIALISTPCGMEEYEFGMLHENTELDKAEKEARKYITALPQVLDLHTLQLVENDYFVLTNGAQTEIAYGRKNGSFTGYYALPKPEKDEY